MASRRGDAKGFAAAGFARVDAHWLSKPEALRSVYRVDLTAESPR